MGLAPVSLGHGGERYPHQFSGGQRQRVGIARALIMNPKLIIADECISALDVSIQAQVVNLMKDIQQETGTAYLFMTFPWSSTSPDRIGVLHLGHLLETGTTEEIFENPIHPLHPQPAVGHPCCRTRWWKSAVWLRPTTMPLPASTTAKGTDHLVSGSHYVKCTDEEFAKWCK